MFVCIYTILQILFENKKYWKATASVSVGNPQITSVAIVRSGTLHKVKTKKKTIKLTKFTNVPKVM